jgi:hypothetical protein
MGITLSKLSRIEPLDIPLMREPRLIGAPQNAYQAIDTALERTG